MRTRAAVDDSSRGRMPRIPMHGHEAATENYVERSMHLLEAVHLSRVADVQAADLRRSAALRILPATCQRRLAQVQLQHPLCHPGGVRRRDVRAEMRRHDARSANPCRYLQHFAAMPQVPMFIGPSRQSCSSGPEYAAAGLPVFVAVASSCGLR
eukprot:TRINITY_DN38345_c0_g1_i5.p2 TRINITY_DN38345_c0_g1~~TRINITY_DN38345_c0_g1_i5.p2  ORF type:complete len:154 (+),score=8.84 TRINITY_DN38345_c0_g1_i5:138-599(+)